MTSLIHWLGEDSVEEDFVDFETFEEMTKGVEVVYREDMVAHVEAGHDVWVWYCPYAADVNDEALVRWALSEEAAEECYREAADDI